MDFETRLIARPGLGAVLDRELRAKSYRVAVMALGTNTDPYQPIEAQYGVMRELLCVLHAFRHPVAITTKGALIEADLDLLADLAAQGLLRVGISLTTLDPDLSRRMEPRAPAPARRLQSIERLAQAGIPVRAMIAPVIPGLTDHEVGTDHGRLPRVPGRRRRAISRCGCRARCRNFVSRLAGRTRARPRH